MKTKRKTYTSPSIETTLIVLEEGIATASATIQPGGPTNPSNPEIDYWKEQSSIHDLEF